MLSQRNTRVNQPITSLVDYRARAIPQTSASHRVPVCTRYTGIILTTQQNDLSFLPTDRLAGRDGLGRRASEPISVMSFVIGAAVAMMFFILCDSN